MLHVGGSRVSSAYRVDRQGSESREGRGGREGAVSSPLGSIVVDSARVGRCRSSFVIIVRLPAADCVVGVVGSG